MIDQETVTQSAWAELSEAAHRDRRRDKRIALIFPIEVCGLDVAHEFFAERSRTWDVSEHGCRFALRNEVSPGAIIAIRMLHRDSERPVSEPILFQVEWVQLEPDRCLVGASSLQGRAVWNLGFPEAT